MRTALPRRVSRGARVAAEGLGRFPDPNSEGRLVLRDVGTNLVVHPTGKDLHRHRLGVIGLDYLQVAISNLGDGGVEGAAEQVEIAHHAELVEVVAGDHYVDAV